MCAFSARPGAIQPPESALDSWNLRAENQALREFHGILLNEQACLVESDVDALLQITQLKSDKVDLLAELEAARSKHLHALGLDASREGAADWLSRYPDPPTSRARPAVG